MKLHKAELALVLSKMLGLALCIPVALAQNRLLALAHIRLPTLALSNLLSLVQSWSQPCYNNFKIVPKTITILPLVNNRYICLVVIP